MISDWIRGLRDPEILYKKFLLLADQLEDSTRRIFVATIAGLEAFRKFTWWTFLFALGTSVGSCVIWPAMRALGVDSATPFHFLIILNGLAWAMFLVLVAVWLGSIEGIIRQFPVIRDALRDIKESVVRWLRLPAWLAFMALFVAILVSRFPSLLRTDSLLTILEIVAAFGFATYLGVLRISPEWMRRMIVFQLVAAFLFLVVAPQFPHATAWMERQSGLFKRTIGQRASPQRVIIDPASPPAFFDSVLGEPLFWYSRRPSDGFAVWDAPGFDPDTNDKLEPIRTKELREQILAWLKTEAQNKPRTGIINTRKDEYLDGALICTANTWSDLVLIKENIRWFRTPPVPYKLRLNELKEVECHGLRNEDINFAVHFPAGVTTIRFMFPVDTTILVRQMPYKPPVDPVAPSGVR